MFGFVGVVVVFCVFAFVLLLFVVLVVVFPCLVFVGFTCLLLLFSLFLLVAIWQLKTLHSVFVHHVETRRRTAAEQPSTDQLYLLATTIKTHDALPPIVADGFAINVTPHAFLDRARHHVRTAAWSTDGFIWE